MKAQQVQERRQSRGLRGWFSFALAMITCSLIVAAPAVQAQIPFTSSGSTANAPRTKPWWDPARAERCGRLWCSQVLIPYFAFGRENENIVVTIAANPNETESDFTQAVEQRSETISESFNAVLTQLRRSLGRFNQSNKIDWSELGSHQKHSIWFWLVTTPKPLHPQIPRIEVGRLNNATVIVVLANEGLELSQQILATVTDTDAQHAGLKKENLGNQWKQTLLSSLNMAMWGLEFNRSFPFARPILVLLTLVIGLITVFLLTSLRRLFRHRLRAIRVRLNELDDQAKRAAMASTDFPEQARLIPAHFDKPQADYLASDAGLHEYKVEREPSEESQSTLTAKPWWAQHVARSITFAINTLTKNTDLLTQRRSRQEIDKRVLLRQAQSGMKVLVHMLQLLRFSIVIAGILFILLVKPEFYIFALGMAKQAVLIPVIWIGVSLVELLIDLSIDHSLDNWVKESLFESGSSSRYQLRATTYAKVSKGIARMFCIVLGIYITMMALGVDPSVLAGASLIAVAIGFLSRDLLADTINGILILATDRFAIGDVINVGSSGGFVENMNLAATQLRSADGELITIPNREILTVANLSKDWSRVNFEVNVSASADLRHVLKVVKDVADQLCAATEWKPLILQSIEVLGVDRIEHSGSQIRVWIMTKPLKQWLVGREFRLRIKEAFNAHCIELGMPHRRIEMVQGTRDIS